VANSDNPRVGTEVEDFVRDLVVRRSPGKEGTLAEYYWKHCQHLVPDDVELWELDPVTREGRLLNKK